MHAYPTRAVRPVTCVEFLQQLIRFRLTRGQCIAPAGNTDPVVVPTGDFLEQVDAIVGEGRHDRMRPPVAVVFA